MSVASLFFLLFFLSACDMSLECWVFFFFHIKSTRFGVGHTDYPFICRRNVFSLKKIQLNFPDLNSSMSPSTVISFIYMGIIQFGLCVGAYFWFSSAYQYGKKPIFYGSFAMKDISDAAHLKYDLHWTVKQLICFLLNISSLFLWPQQNDCGSYGGGGGDGGCLHCTLR